MNNVLVAEHLPVSASMRKSALRKFGGSLASLWTDSHRFDSGKRSRSGSGHRTHKDYRINGGHRRSYKPWRKQGRITDHLIEESFVDTSIDPLELEIFD